MNYLYKKSWIVLSIIFLALVSLKFTNYFDPIFGNLFQKRVDLYPRFLIFISIFFGFTSSSLGIVLSLSDKSPLKEFFIRVEEGPLVFDTFIRALFYLGLSCLTLFVLICFDRQNIQPQAQSVLTFARWCLLFFFMKGAEKIFWNLFIFKKLIKVVKTNWNEERKSYKLELEESLKAKKK